MSRSTGLSLQPDDDRPPRETPQRAWPLVLAGFLVVACGVLGYLVYQSSRRTRALEEQVARLESATQQANVRAQEAFARSEQAESSAKTAAEGRQAAEAKTATAEGEAETARLDAATARDEAAKATAEAEAVRKRAEAEMTRLEDALSKIAETHRTALGVVMNLGSDHLKFEFNKADLRPADRELLSRVAGILLSSEDYTISVNGHTDDVGSADYNQKLSERRAQAVRDYLVSAGLSPQILSVNGHGKALPLVQGATDAARAKNRRVELAIANTRIQYGRQRQ